MNFDLTILGSGSALPTSRRYSTAHVLNVHGRFFLIDCGEGTQIQLRKAKVRFGKLNHLFISHLHGDHVFGLFGLLSSLNLLGRTADFFIFGPKETENIIKFYTAQFSEGMQYKIVFIPHQNRSFSEIYADDHLRVYSFPLKHRVPTWGYLFCEQPKPPNIKKESITQYNLSIKDIVAIKNGEDFIDSEGNIIPNEELVIPPRLPRKYAFCSDTGYYERIIPWVEGVNLLYHEATFANADRKLAKQTSHSTATQAATIAKKAGVEKLVIGHISNRYNEAENLRKEAAGVFPNTIMANDLDEFVIE